MAVQPTTLEAQPVVAVRTVVSMAEPASGLPPLAADGEIGATELPGGEVGTYLHVGPYPDLGGAYQVIEAWLTDAGRSAGGAPWESYVVAPDDVDHDPARLETLVCWPLA